jgi:Uma2 family endonuclease
MAVELKQRPFTVEEYHRLVEVGILEERERVELLDGLLVEMSPIGLRHWERHYAVVRYLSTVLGERAMVCGQASLPLGEHSEPQPDIAVLAPQSYVRLGRPPLPEEILAIVELADSSLATDTGPKRRLYAGFRIADYLVVNLEDDVLLHYVHRGGEDYGAAENLERESTFRLRAFPDVELHADPFLGPPRWPLG